MAKRKHRRVKQCRVCAAHTLAERTLTFGFRTIFINLPWAPSEAPEPFDGDPETLPLTACFDAARERYPEHICRHGALVLIRGSQEECVDVINAVIAEAKRTLTDEREIQKAESYLFMARPPARSTFRRIIRIRPDPKRFN